MIRVLVVAYSPVVRAGLSAVLTANPNFSILGSTSSLDTLIGDIEQLQPDVVLLDLNGYSQSRLWEKQYTTAILVIAEDFENFEENLTIYEAFGAGVRGILLETSTESEIIAAVETVAMGLVVLHPDVVESLLPLKQSTRQDKLLTNPIQALTPREIEVLQMLGSGNSNKAIAKDLHISEHTVKFHISSIFQKLGVSTRTEAVSVGLRLGLILL